jgi:hypothetical protein
VRALAALCLVFALADAPAEAQGRLAPPTLPYDLQFEATLIPTDRLARVRMRMGPNQVNRMLLRIDPQRHTNLRADGKLVIEGRSARWEPPRVGGSLRYEFRVDALRNASAYDARISQQWAIFRGGDLFPPARVRAEAGAYSRSTLRLRVPEGWSIAVPYERVTNGTYKIENEHRHFDRPTAWMVLGHIGVLRERIAGSSVAVAGPFRQKLRRHDILALLRWTLPSLRSVIGALPPRLLVAGAGDPMWRGGLSGPDSVFVHAERPLITPDGSSPILHEMFHAVSGAHAAVDGDWVVEGLAELYSYELLARSRSMSRARIERMLRRVAARGAKAPLRGHDSTGASTDRAVSVLRELDAELRARTEQQKTLDDVVAELARRRQAVSTASFQATAEQISGLELDEFFRTKVEPILERNRR